MEEKAVRDISDSTYSQGYHRNCPSSRAEHWWDLKPFSTVLWMNAIAERERNNSWYCVRENHMSMIVEYWLEGRSIYEIDGPPHIITPGTLCVTWPRNPKLVLRDCQQEFARNIRLVLTGGALLGMVELLDMNKQNIFKLNASQQTSFLRRCEQFFDLLKRKNPRSAKTVALRSYELLLFVHSLCEAEVTDEDPKINFAMKLMVNCREDVKSVAQIAELCGISLSTLNRIFNDRFGMSPKQYWDKIRFEHAAISLASTDLPIKEIGFNNGFGDPLYFSTAFRKHFKCSPSEYRQQAKNNNSK